jgi:hypothetical protein
LTIIPLSQFTTNQSINHSVPDPDTLNPDPDPETDPEPGILLNQDPDPACAESGSNPFLGLPGSGSETLEK